MRQARLRPFIIVIIVGMTWLQAGKTLGRAPVMIWMQLSAFVALFGAAWNAEVASARLLAGEKSRA